MAKLSKKEQLVRRIVEASDDWQRELARQARVEATIQALQDWDTSAAEIVGYRRYELYIQNTVKHGLRLLVEPQALTAPREYGRRKMSVEEKETRREADRRKREQTQPVSRQYVNRLITGWYAQVKLGTMKPRMYKQLSQKAEWVWARVEHLQPRIVIPQFVGLIYSKDYLKEIQNLNTL